MKKILFFLLLMSYSIPNFAKNNVELAQDLSTILTNFISLPFQFNYNYHINIFKTGHQTYLNFQPVIPIPITNDWSVISRTILPIVDQVNVLPGSGTQRGLSDALQSFFLVPRIQNLVLGIGPAISVPVASDPLLGSERWDLGPTALIAKITGPWTFGFLGYQIWSVSRNSRTPHSLSFFQPFVSYTTPTAWTFTVNSETSYDWKGNNVSVPFNFVSTKLFFLNKQPLNIGGGLRYWAKTPETGAKDFGIRLVVTFLFA